MVQKVKVKRELEARLRNTATGKLSVNLAVNGYLFRIRELGKDKADNAAKGKAWAPPFISYAQDTVGL